MKNYWKSYAIIACSAILIACSTNEGIRDVDSGNVQNTGNIESEINANLILVNYMHVVDSCVVLNLSQKEAEALGVSDYYYQKAQKTVLDERIHKGASRLARLLERTKGTSRRK